MMILCLDFDGVIHSYSSGWQGADVIPDPPVPGAIEFIREATKHFDVNIFSSRSHQTGGAAAMRNWLTRWASDERNNEDNAWLELIKYPLEKPPAMVTLDDRAITFTGVWPPISELLAFVPWNKRQSVVDHYKLYPSLAAKIGSILVHVEEGLSPDAHEFDWAAVKTLLMDADVQGWLTYLGPLVPKKRR